MLLSVIVPASNEEGYIGECLQSLLEQDDTVASMEIIVVANGCLDRTVDIARSYEPAFKERNWRLEVLDLAEPGKPNALNRGDQAASGGYLVYLDADVRCDPELFGQLRAALSKDTPIYASGKLQVAQAETWITRKYAQFWTQLPFVQSGAVGAGLFGVNRSGRARWGEFPTIISDDTFVRLQFSPEERIEVPAGYFWPMVEGYSNLVRVRKRQDQGVAEIYERYPQLLENEGKSRLTVRDLARLMVLAPIGFFVYVVIHISVRLRPSNTGWARGR